MLFLILARSSRHAFDHLDDNRRQIPREARGRLHPPCRPDDRLPVRRQDQPRTGIGDLDPVAAGIPRLLKWQAGTPQPGAAGIGKSIPNRDRQSRRKRRPANSLFLSGQTRRTEAPSAGCGTNLQHLSPSYCPRRLNRLCSDRRHSGGHRTQFVTDRVQLS
jgi:hypothetical protein